MTEKRRARHDSRGGRGGLRRVGALRGAGALWAALALILLGVGGAWAAVPPALPADPSSSGLSSDRGFPPSAAPLPLRVRRVYLAPLEGVVAPAMEEWLDRALATAEADPEGMLVLRVDSPGGLVASMGDMVRRIAGARCPVAAWVAPEGGRAASAGAFLVLAAPIAAMAPSTNIGAAHPVSVGGKDIPDRELGRKITNDLSARIRALAQERGRNPAACAAMVEKSASYSAEEAIRLGVVDYGAESLPALLEGADGRVLRVAGRPVRLECSRYEFRALEMPARLQFLAFVSRPDVAYLALSAGLFALVLEVMAPGGFLLGTAGALLMLVGAYGMKILPVNWAGLALLAAGVAIMVADLAVGGVGILAALGLGALVLGGLLVYRAPGGELLNVSLHFMAGSLLVLGLFFGVALWAVARSLRRPPTSGSEGLVGAAGEVREACDPFGTVFVRGEYWRARAVSGSLPEGAIIRVIRVEGLLLLVGSPEGETSGEAPRTPPKASRQEKGDLPDR